MTISEIIEEEVEVTSTGMPTAVGVSTVGAVISVSSSSAASVTASSSDGNLVSVEVDSTPGPRTSVDTPSQVVVQASGTLPGPSGVSQDIFTRVAATDLSGHRVVKALVDGTVAYASNDDLADNSRALWLTLNAALAGSEVLLQSFGDVTEPSWSWTPGPIYLGTDGVLTQVEPTAMGGAAFLVQVASADTATDVFYDPRMSIGLTE